MSAFRIGDESLGVSRLPYRKAKALYAIKGSELWPLAYFRNDEAAAEAERLLQLLAEGALVRNEQLFHYTKNAVLND